MPKTRTTVLDIENADPATEFVSPERLLFGSCNADDARGAGRWRHLPAASRSKRDLSFAPHIFSANHGVSHSKVMDLQRALTLNTITFALISLTVS